jgi:16S rRNA (uracil1498-N3)-methyltransferase
VCADKVTEYRFFAEGLPGGVGETVSLSAGEAHHALHVLRLRAGAAVELFDGRGGRAQCAIARAGRSEVVVEARRLLAPRSRRGPAVHVGFAVPKGSRLDWLLEKATELGAASLAPVRFERSVAGAAEFSPAARGRWMGHCVAAAKQCGLDFLPAIEAPATLREFLAKHGSGGAGGGRGGDFAAGRLLALGDAGADALPLGEALSRWRGGREACLLVGPEGGLTAAERGEAVAAGFVPARLGETTLRVETAAVAMLACVVAAGQKQ